MEVVRRHFRPEFLNRIDEIVQARQGGACGGAVAAAPALREQVAAEWAAGCTILVTVLEQGGGRARGAGKLARWWWQAAATRRPLRASTCPPPPPPPHTHTHHPPTPTHRTSSPPCMRTTAVLKTNQSHGVHFPVRTAQFDPLSLAQLREVARLQTVELNQRLKDRSITMQLTGTSLASSTQHAVAPASPTHWGRTCPVPHSIPSTSVAQMPPWTMRWLRATTTTTARARCAAGWSTAS